MAGLQSTRPIMDLWYLMYYNWEASVEIPFYPNSLKQKNNSSLQLHRLPLRKLRQKENYTYNNSFNENCIHLSFCKFPRNPI